MANYFGVTGNWFANWEHSSPFDYLIFQWFLKSKTFKTDGNYYLVLYEKNVGITSQSKIETQGIQTVEAGAVSQEPLFVLIQAPKSYSWSETPGLDDM